MSDSRRVRQKTMKYNNIGDLQRKDIYLLIIALLAIIKILEFEKLFEHTEQHKTITIFFEFNLKKNILFHR